MVITGDSSKNQLGWNPRRLGRPGTRASVGRPKIGTACTTAVVCLRVRRWFGEPPPTSAADQMFGDSKLHGYSYGW
ncbi:hypothetical protein PN498_16310 [Oscillatoria sp. CS-180]|uniref:hypothetical protein n=1 Tax=Oscillatoria sp. CS-180 TaxID=3021720 RepID=UPI00232BACC2|nr:hypothetical protein [Oscillatoria sp. CS-180]MDB9527563.1 hypothetical protein [Oscillatoria sp. CS-180]